MALIEISADELISMRGFDYDSRMTLKVSGVNNDNLGEVVKILKNIRGDIAENEVYGGQSEIVIQGEEVTQKSRFNYADLRNILYILSGENGCEWDKAQTMESIRSNTIEEAYELVEAVNNHDIPNIIEEAGDVILQGAFNAVIAEKENLFNTEDVFTMLCRKLITRHTHIFGDVKANNAEEALAAWEAAKAKEKKYVKPSSKMDGLAKALPALVKAYKVQKTAAKYNFEFASVSDAADKVKEELDEFINAGESDKEEEGGDLIFAAVNVLRMRGTDPEVALMKAVNKFIRRFKYAEEKCGGAPEKVSARQLDALWREAKEKGL